MKILVIQQKMIGDVLVSSILCNNLKKAYPNAEIHYMVYEFTTPVLKNNPNIDKLVLFTDKHRKSKFTFFKLLMSIRKEKYDVIIDAYSKLESWLTVFFSGAKQKISYKKSGRSFLYTDAVKLIDKPTSNLGLTIERRLSLLNPLQLDIQLEPVPKLFLTKEETASARKLFIEHDVDSSKKTIMLSILGSTDNKTYPLNYMAQLIDFIADYYDANLLFNYMPSQLKQAKEIYEQCKPSTKKQIYIDLIASSLRDYIAVMNQCDMIIGNDGGAINIAKSLNKPSFIIFSPWIEKEVWATFEDGKFHKSVHLLDYKPQLFKGKTEKELKKQSIALYQHFEPTFIFEELKSFLAFNLSSNNQSYTLNIENIEPSEARVNKLSALVIVLNEADSIQKTVENLSFADEIIVLDSFSTDDTVKIVKSFSDVKLIQRAFLNFSDQRNFAIKQASHNWILFLDADEWIDCNLKNEILKTVQHPKEKVAFAIPRQFYFQGKKLKYSGFQTDKSYRLFHKEYAQYDTKKFVHETLLVNGKTSVLKNEMQHFSYKTFDSYKDKMDNYAKLRAKELYGEKLKPNFYHFGVKPVYRFIYHYVIRLGFLDGNKGYTIAKLNAYGVKQRYVQLQQIYKNKND